MFGDPAAVVMIKNNRKQKKVMEKVSRENFFMINLPTLHQFSEANLEPTRTSTMNLFTKIVNGIVDVRVGSKYSYDIPLYLTVF